MGRQLRGRRAKHWDFILLDTASLQIAFQLGYWLRYRTFFNYLSNRDYRVTAIVLFVLSVFVAVLINTMNEVLTRGLLKEIRSTILQCGAVFAGIVILLYSVKNSDHISRIVMYLAMILYFAVGLLARLAYRMILLRLNRGTRPQDTGTSGETEGDTAASVVSSALAKEADESGSAEGVTAGAEEKEDRSISLTADGVEENILEIQKEDGRIETIVVNQSVAYRVIKRISDIILSIIALIIFSPVLLITSIAILLEDGGPVIFKQDRCGLNGKVFGMYKLRSMVKNAPVLHKSLLDQNELDGPAFKMKDDPRTTKVGRVIRRTSIDELPQLVNIIKGEMSIVGPRPLPVYETEKCNAYQNQRLLMKPGLTCYWQVMGRSNIGFADWISLDLKYIKNAGIMTDLGLIIMTFGAVLSGRGAE